MPPKVLHRPITRKLKAASQEESSAILEPTSVAPASLIDTRSDFPSPPTSPRPSRPSSCSLHEAVEDTQGVDNDSPLSLSKSTTAPIATKKRGRGISVGKSIEKAIVENDGKLLEIEFPEGFRKPRRFAYHLANGIGIVVRHSPELDCISHWSDIPEHKKITRLCWIGCLVYYQGIGDE
ncbi:hypothetical protein Salat_1680400 [Sesamum alatum]|uniref:Uncharacterized protein n=1 Tax=Sesamum alatum TaxID=300844 RepID=A0AAE1Y706_9LAMI|nr:hypothetical protein Salat_1680400 [Sesamum alatum]